MKRIFRSFLFVVLLPFFANAQSYTCNGFTTNVKTTKVSNGKRKFDTTIDGYPSSNTRRFYIFEDGHYMKAGNPILHNYASSNWSPTIFTAKAYDPSDPCKIIHTIDNNLGTNSNGNPAMPIPPNEYAAVDLSWDHYQDGYLHNNPYYIVMVQNIEEQPISGCLIFEFKSSQLLKQEPEKVYNSWASPGIYTSTGNPEFDQRATWEVINLLPGEQRAIYLPLTIRYQFELFTPIDVRFAFVKNQPSHVGNFLCEPSTFDNFSSLVQNAPYDPNFIKSKEDCLKTYITQTAHAGNAKMLEKQKLHYSINFQNEGEAFANMVQVIDRLDPNLDGGSIQITSSSHPCTLVNLPSGSTNSSAAFIFQNINLPGLNQTQPRRYHSYETKGFVNFSICTKSAIVPSNGLLINNSAAIYFDSQLPVFTNIDSIYTNSPCVAEHCELQQRSTQVDIDDTMSKGVLTAYPNPFTNNIHVESDLFQYNSELTIMTLTGQIVYDKKIEGNKLESFTVDVNTSEFSPGIYFVVVKNQYDCSIAKIIKN